MKPTELRKATDAERQQMEAALLAAVVECGVASTDDAHARFELPEDVQPKTWGTITGALQAKTLLCRIGEIKTRRKIANRRRIGVYVAADAEDVRRYLAGLLASLTRRRQETQKTLFTEVEGLLDGYSISHPGLG